MTNLLFYNNAVTTLAAPCGSSDTSCTVASGSGSLFLPGPTGSEYFCLTFSDAATGLANEIVHCTGVSGDTLTIVRAQEGTTAQNWNTGDNASAYVTAGMLETIATEAAPTADKLTTARNIAMSGDASWTVSFDGSASVTAAGTLATVNTNVGSFGDGTNVASVTVNGKGLVTAASSVAITSAPKWATARTLSFTGDATGSGSVDGSASVATALTLATVNSNVGSFGTTTQALRVTVNAKGQVTAASTDVMFPALAWLKFTVSGGTIATSSGSPTALVTSLSRTGTGVFTITAGTLPALSTGWAVIQASSGSGGGGNISASISDDLGTINTVTLANSAVDPHQVLVMFF